MRLIDANTLLEIYTNRLEILAEKYGIRSSECGVLAGAMKLLEIQPTIEPEQKMGKWVHEGFDHPHGVDWMRCSVCGRKEPNVPAALTPYCPTCGAKMEKYEYER